MPSNTKLFFALPMVQNPSIDSASETTDARTAISDCNGDASLGPGETNPVPYASICRSDELLDSEPKDGGAPATSESVRANIHNPDTKSQSEVLSVGAISSLPGHAGDRVFEEIKHSHTFEEHSELSLSEVQKSHDFPTVVPFFSR